MKVKYPIATADMLVFSDTIAQCKQYPHKPKLAIEPRMPVEIAVSKIQL
jgi:hypothetical protein